MSTTSFFTLFESASGWAVFSILESEEIGALIADVSHGGIYRNSNKIYGLVFSYQSTLLFVFRCSFGVGSKWCSRLLQIPKSCKANCFPSFRFCWKCLGKFKRCHWARTNSRFKELSWIQCSEGKEEQGRSIRSCKYSLL